MTEPVDDPYAVLGVARDATDAEIRRAYERRMADAAAAGTLRIAQKVDAAFSVLRDPYRRALFDREGRIVDLPRLAPDERPVPLRAVPFRSWPPPDQHPSRRGQRFHASRRRGREVLRAFVALAVVAVVVTGGWKLGLVRHRSAPALAGDVWHPTATTPGAFPVRYASHRQRLLPPVTAPGGSGGFAFELPAPGGPTRWDPCVPVRYVVSGNQPFIGAGGLLTSAIDEVSADTGLQFVYAGTTTEQPTENRPADELTRYGKGWAPVLIAWTGATVMPRLAGRVVGIGSGTSVTLAGQPRVVSGIVALDGPDLAAIIQRPGGSVEARTVMLHELGHLVGLAHVNDPTQVMNPTAMPLAHYATGDRRGLAVLGAGPCPTTY